MKTENVINNQVSFSHISVIPLLSLVKALETFSASRLFFPPVAAGDALKTRTCSWATTPSPLCACPQICTPKKQTLAKRPYIERLCCKIWIPSPQLLLTQRVHEGSIQKSRHLLTKHDSRPASIKRLFKVGSATRYHCSSVFFRKVTLFSHFVVIWILCFLHTHIYIFNGVILIFCYWSVVVLHAFQNVMFVTMYSDFCVAFVLGTCHLWGGVGIWLLPSQR